MVEGWSAPRMGGPAGTMVGLAIALGAVHLAAKLAHVWQSHQPSGRPMLLLEAVHYGSKCPPILCLLAALWLAFPRGLSPRYPRLVALGLGLSAVGDFLLLPAVDRFVPGLVAFLLAHLSYIGAMRDPATAAPPLLVPASLGIAAGFAGLGLGVFFTLRPFIEQELEQPVLAYSLVIALMGWTAAVRVAVPDPSKPEPGRLTQQGHKRALCAAVVFMLSDSVLAVWKFHPSAAPVRPELDFVVMVTYYAAQVLFFLSTLSYATAAGRPHRD